MDITVPEHIFTDAIQSAQSGAFSAFAVQPATEKEIEESLTWLDYIESHTKGYREATAKAEKDRLVKRRKSPTRLKSDDNPRSKRSLLDAQAFSFNKLMSAALDKFTPQERAQHLCINADETLDIQTGEVRGKRVQEVERGHFASKPLEADKTAKVHFQSRNWSSDYRIVCTQNTRASDAPDANTGDRVTQTVTSRARGKIVDSGLYMQAVKGGFNSFLTVTLDADARKKLNEKHLKKDRGGNAGEIIKPWFNASGEKLVFPMAENNEIIASGRFTHLKYDFSTIGEQLSPFFDALGKMHKRGFVATGQIAKTPTAKKYTWGEVECIGRADRLYPWGKVSSVGGKGRVDSDLIKSNERLYPWGLVECVGEDSKPVFDYLWCAEAPHTGDKNESKKYKWGEVECIGQNERLCPWGKVSSVGEQNYHAHVLMRWNVEPVFFHEWAARIENIWSQGFVTIERIKNAKAAAAYLLKALGYMVKGGEGSQGEIRGNRYNISKYARAEGWENCATHEAQHMYGLIQEYAQGIEAKKQRKIIKQSELKKTLGTIEKLTNVNKKDFSEKRQQFIENLKNKLEQVSEKVSELSSELNGNFAMGGVAKFASETAFVGFIDWAIGVRGWQLKTSFLNSTSADVESEKTEETAVNKLLKQTRKFYDDSMAALCDFYSRFEPVDNYGVL